MGELTGSFIDSPEGQIAQDRTPVEPPDGKVTTDVDGCFADAEFRGSLVFDVTKDEFYNNMKADRKRLRFRSGTPAQEYYSKTRYKTPFFIRNQEDGYMRKIK
jgi:hypothetical protein